MKDNEWVKAHPSAVKDSIVYRWVPLGVIGEDKDSLLVQVCYPHADHDRYVCGTMISDGSQFRIPRCKTIPTDYRIPSGRLPSLYTT